MEFLCNLSDIDGMENKRFVIGKQPILLCYSESKYYAFIDQCPHAMKSMEGGKIKNGKLFCPLHGASFLLETGEVKSAPALRGLKKLDLELKQKKIYVKI